MDRRRLRILLLTAIIWLGLFSAARIWAQDGADHSYKPLMLKLNEDGSKYVRFITWHQVWATFSANADDEVAMDLQLRRSRFLAYAQVSPRFLILTHFGLNSLSRSGLDGLGALPQAQLFMHDAWVEYQVFKNALYIGGGLHYWNGISRLSSNSTLNFMTMDAPRFNWPSIGTTDQFARHLGIYAKGQLGRLDYRVSVNEAIANTLDMQRGLKPGVDTAVYLNQGGKVYNGYVNYQFLDKESNKLPYMVGTYIGKKKILNLGAGWSYHPNGSTSLDENLGEVRHDVLLWSADLFYDVPVGQKGAALSVYGAFYDFDFGPNYRLTGNSDLVATGNVYYGQIGYALPVFSKGQFMPYVEASLRQIEAVDASANTIGIGLNYFILDHNAKITLEYNTTDPATSDNRVSFLRVQGHIFL